MQLHQFHKARKIDTVIPCIFNQMRPGATFLAVNGYTNNFGEVANFSIVFGSNYLNSVKKSLNIWARFRPVGSLQIKAHAQLMTSYGDTLRTGFNHRAWSAHAYSPVKDCNGNIIKGVKLHLRERVLHLTGLLVRKNIITPGNYSRDNRSRLTVEKDLLIGMTPLKNFRQFKLMEGRFDNISVQKLTLTQQDIIRKAS